MNTKRILVGVIALYAVFLERVAVCAMPAAIFDSLGGITCLRDVGVPGAPANDFHRHHDACCVLACDSAGFAAAPAASGASAYSGSIVSPFVFEAQRTGGARSPLKFYFAARGPPPPGPEI